MQDINYINLIKQNCFPLPLYRVFYLSNKQSTYISVATGPEVAEQDWKVRYIWTNLIK